MAKLKPVHPGEILWEDFMKPLRLNPHKLALAVRVPAPRINDIVRGRRAITLDTALRLARYFGTTPQFWLNLQTAYELDVAEDSKLVREIRRDVRPVEAQAGGRAR